MLNKCVNFVRQTRTLVHVMQLEKSYDKKVHLQACKLKFYLKNFDFLFRACKICVRISSEVTFKIDMYST